jgi:uncharacterized protein YjhX (UPF0386 family)
MAIALAAKDGGGTMQGAQRLGRQTTSVTTLLFGKLKIRRDADCFSRQGWRWNKALGSHFTALLRCKMASSKSAKDGGF